MGLKSYQSLRCQNGIGLIGILLVTSVCIFLGLFAIKVGPHYYQNWTVTTVANELAANADMLGEPRSKVYAYINQAYRTNSLWDLKAEDTIKLEKDLRKGYLVRVQYEQRAKLFHNIDVVTSFDKAAN